VKTNTPVGDGAQPSSRNESVRGIALVLLSALCFSFATTIAKFAYAQGATAPHVTLLRFGLGFLAAVVVAAKNRAAIRPVAPLWVLLRAVSNAAVVFLLFYSVQFTTVTKANMLNMTYPAFVFVFAPFITGDRTTRMQFVALAATIAGVVFVVQPFGAQGLSRLQSGDIMAILSALSAGFAIAVLRRARRSDSTVTIMLYLMGIGLIANIILLIGSRLPGPQAMLLAAGAGAFGAAGQFAFTAALNRISATSGAVVSTSRIVFATILGSVLLADQLTVATVIGGVLILASIVLVSRRPKGRDFA